MRAIILISVLALSGCFGNLQTKDVLDAAKISDKQCGKARITGNLDVGCRFGMLCTSVMVDIDKNKPTYTDAAGTEQPCP